MLNEKSDLSILEGCMPSIREDLRSRNEVCEALALATLGNIGSGKLAEELGDIVV